MGSDPSALTPSSWLGGHGDSEQTPPCTCLGAETSRGVCQDWAPRGRCPGASILRNSVFDLFVQTEPVLTLTWGHVLQKPLASPSRTFFSAAGPGGHFCPSCPLSSPFSGDLSCSSSRPLPLKSGQGREHWGEATGRLGGTEASPEWGQPGRCRVSGPEQDWAPGSSSFWWTKASPDSHRPRTAPALPLAPPLPEALEVRLGTVSELTALGWLRLPHSGVAATLPGLWTFLTWDTLLGICYHRTLESTLSVLATQQELLPAPFPRHVPWGFFLGGKAA